MPNHSISGSEVSILWRFSQLSQLTADEQQHLLSLVGPPRYFDRGKQLHIEGDEPGLFFLAQGWVLSAIDTVNGGRQVLKVHRSGDLMGAPSLPFTEAVETLIALTRCKVSVISRSTIGALFTDWPRLSAILFSACQVERVVLMDRMVSFTRFNAKENFTATLLHLFRTKPPGEEGDVVSMPLTQIQLGEVLGLTAVHVNRVVNQLEREGMIRREGYAYHLLDIPRLEAIANMPHRLPMQGASWLPPAK